MATISGRFDGSVRQQETAILLRLFSLNLSNRHSDRPFAFLFFTRFFTVDFSANQ
ncbi:hypothetical protein GJA_2961 [Janthinobacterium agaricidamnosum NBRC 102515 = DSM 9628]|uniref:Uncharacterized protein n=1 Tax=Janthinobacterium agaricidamnosum NBRC 102515 = DSM 9628 TaxID=1349767 RepID=W0V8J6_9BURK|nr:hypothetical protein GJA_2961 [Janthinobacterium agaricidamnosum NBRC 102515 = DSM 9628]